MHRWVNWIAGFSSTFVERALEQHLPEPNASQTILDPFGGVGTAPITAYLRGHSVISYDINPFAYLVQRAKFSAFALDADIFLEHIQAFSQYMKNEASPISQPPEGFRTRIPFFSESILIKVLRVWDYIASIENRDVERLFKVAFAGTMVSYSNYTYEPSLSSRPGAGKPLLDDADVTQTILEKLLEMHSDVNYAYPLHSEQRHETLNTSFLKTELQRDSVDLVITSPPYLNNYHYLRNTRPQLYWLGFAQQPSDLKYLEEDNYGKFWQTVREPRYHTKLCFSSKWLQGFLDELALIQAEKSIYGGKGWANYACEYFNDTYRFLSKLHHAMKGEAKALIVVGNSIIKGVNIPVDRVFTHVAEHLGFTNSAVHVVRDTRVGSSIVGTGARSKGKSNKLYEVVVELTK